MFRPKRIGTLLKKKSVRKMGDGVGATYITVVIRNPHEPDRVWEGEFLIDTGAVDTLVPRQHLEAIGIVPDGQRVYGLADGQEIRLDVAVVRLEFLDEIVGGTVAFGAEGVEPLLGVTALESAGVEVDPHNETFSKLSAIRMRGFRPRRLR